MNFVIEKNIPIETTYDRYPFSKMEIGDSFAVPANKYRSVIHAAAQQKRRKGLEFKVRKTDEGFRCWRVA